MWIGIRQRFSRFHDGIQTTPDRRTDGLTKQHRVRQALQRAYYGAATESPPGLIVGSWGQQTETRPTNDVDIFFPLPYSEFQRFDAYSGNGQSALLQDVKEKLEMPYPQTRMRGDGQVVQVNFNTIGIELVPVFSLGDSGEFVMPDTNDGGRWKIVNPYADQNLLTRHQNTRRFGFTQHSALSGPGRRHGPWRGVSASRACRMSTRT